MRCGRALGRLCAARSNARLRPTWSHLCPTLTVLLYCSHVARVRHGYVCSPSRRIVAVRVSLCVLLTRPALPAAAPSTVDPDHHAGNQALANVFGEWMAAWTGFFFITLASSQCSLIVRYVNLPLITGYMFFGVLVGPQILDMVTARTQHMASSGTGMQQQKGVS